MGYENSGRRPQPTALKMLRGNPGKRRPNTHEPAPPPGAVVQPEGLSASAAAIWDELAPICLHMGTLTPADLRPFRTLCELQASLERASALKTVGEWETAMKLERDFAGLIRPYYALFGLEPVSRARITVPKADDAGNKWDGVIGAR
jgi:phage terminase small subunit